MTQVVTYREGYLNLSLSMSGSQSKSHDRRAEFPIKDDPRATVKWKKASEGHKLQENSSKQAKFDQNL